MVEEKPTLDLLELIYGIVERLMLTTQFNQQELVKLLQPIRDDLAGMQEQYRAPAPDAAVQELMKESLTLYDQSLGEILAFLDDPDEDRLRRAVLMGEEATDILSAVEYIIQTNKNVLSEMVEA